MTEWLPVILMLSSLFLLLLTVFLFLYYGSQAAITVFFMLGIFFGIIASCIFIYDRTPSKILPVVPVVQVLNVDIVSDPVVTADDVGYVKENEIDNYINNYC